MWENLYLNHQVCQSTVDRPIQSSSDDSRFFVARRRKQLKQKLVEPNSVLGKAIKYMQNHWFKLTLFLKVEGSLLYNNIVERSLKRVILHWKN
jgi:hypothetical protein